MDAVSYSHADKQKQRIEKIIANPDSTSGIVTVPKVIASGENITIPTGRVAVLPNVQVDGTLNIEGEVFIPSGATFGDLESQIALKADTSYVNGKYSGFKNLIINGKKQVNQSGLTNTDNAYNYDNHYKVGNNWFVFIDGKNIVSGEPYTLSWEGAATAGYYIGTAGSLNINAQTFVPIANGETITPTITSAQILWIKFASDAAGSTYNKVQLEPGAVATPYEQRLYELEENLVQTCYEVLNYSSFSTLYPNGVASVSISFIKKRNTPIATVAAGSQNLTLSEISNNGARFFSTTGSSYLAPGCIIDARP